VFIVLEQKVFLQSQLGVMLAGSPGRSVPCSNQGLPAQAHAFFQAHVFIQEVECMGMGGTSGLNGR